MLCYYLKDGEKLSAKVARDHYERRDGSAYPRGIELKNTMVEITAVSDIFDAFIAVRPYQSVSYDNRTALDEITRKAENNEIGWEVVRALVAHNRKHKPYYSEVVVSHWEKEVGPLQAMSTASRLSRKNQKDSPWREPGTIVTESVSIGKHFI